MSPLREVDEGVLQEGREGPIRLIGDRQFAKVHVQGMVPQISSLGNCLRLYHRWDNENGLCSLL